eukprot:scaffold1254_cov251-Pinguiococcus_pyrenoidosus.AAC.23
MREGPAQPAEGPASLPGRQSGPWKLREGKFRRVDHFGCSAAPYEALHAALQGCLVARTCGRAKTPFLFGYGTESSADSS